MDTAVAYAPLVENGKLDALVERFLAAQDVKPISREGTRRRLRAFFRWCLSYKVLQPTRESVILYKRHLLEKGHTPYTVSGYLVAVRCLFAYLEAEKLYPNVARAVRGVRRPRGHRRDALTAQQAKDLLASLERTTLQGMRDYAMLSLMLRTGLRTIEITRLSVQDLRQEGGEAILFVWRKNGDCPDSPVLLVENALRPILEYLTARGSPRGDEPLFGSVGTGKPHRLSTRTIRWVVKERLRCIGISSPRLSSHSLRHSCLTYAILAGATLEHAQALAGHSSPATTMLYNHAVDSWRGHAERKVDELLTK